MAHNTKGPGVAKTVKVLVEFTTLVYPYSDEVATVIANRLVTGELPDVIDTSWFSDVRIISSRVVKEEVNSE